MSVKPFVINRYGRMVFPCNFFPELDFSVFQTLHQFNSVIRRDFGEKAPTETEIVARVAGGALSEPLRGLPGSGAEPVLGAALRTDHVREASDALGRFASAPQRYFSWPMYKPRDSAGSDGGHRSGLPPTAAMWDEETEDKSFRMLLDVLRNKQGSGGEFRALRPTVAEILSDPKNQTYRL